MLFRGFAGYLKVRRQMKIPDVPFFAVLAVLPGMLLVAVGFFGLRRAPRLVHASSVCFASGISLLVVPLLSLLVYQLQAVERVGPPALLLAIPALAFGAGLALAVRGRDFEGFRLFGFSMVSLVPVYLLAFYVVLLSACSFGDCL